MRPPWAQAEPDFLDSCSRCGDCVRLCPEAVLIQGDGGYPEINPGAGECSFCRVCVDHCTPQALRLHTGRPWQWHAEVSDHCLAASGIVCQSCKDVCPTAAISFAAGASVAVPRLDSEACSACGACLPICPAQAISLYEIAT
jgi:ferredoxin-type protein NapF